MATTSRADAMAWADGRADGATRRETAMRARGAQSRKRMRRVSCRPSWSVLASGLPYRCLPGCPPQATY